MSSTLEIEMFLVIFISILDKYISFLMDFIFLGFFSTEIFWDCGGGICNKNYRTAPLYVKYISFHNILLSKRSLFLFS